MEAIGPEPHSRPFLGVEKQEHVPSTTVEVKQRTSMEEQTPQPALHKPVCVSDVMTSVEGRLPEIEDVVYLV